MHTRLVSLWLLLGTALLVFNSTASAVTLDWVTVGDPGNAAAATGYGAVANVYQISKYEVTNTQYAEFLNAVAATDTNNLYNSNMGQSHVIYGDHGGITQSGDPGSYTYSVRTDRGDKPVIFVSFWDSLRFVNWLHNGQPSGPQDDSTTEDGAYTITPQGVADNTITRNPEAVIFLPSEDEWYKAAYYDGVSGYFNYPASSSMQTTCWLPGPMTNTANCDHIIDSPDGDLVEVGIYTAAASPSGTFDQGGNVYEWNEAIDSTTKRGLRGGSWSNAPAFLAATDRSAVFPVNEYNNVGFRVARDSCGNGIVDGSETCDDGGTVLGDGCDESCQIEPGWDCSGEPSVCIGGCGDGLVLAPEECDDDGATPGDGCDENCQIEPGWDCSGEPSVCTENCGDGLIAGTEGCDDNGMAPGDGCDESCQIEPGWMCLGEPSVCSVCGDGAILGLEQCDDGDLTPGDGCSAACQIEASWLCQSEPSVCVRVAPALPGWGGVLLVAALLAAGVGVSRRRAA